MIQRFREQRSKKMSPDRQARKLAVIRALKRPSLVCEMDKENNPPSESTPFQLSHSTPYKIVKVTDLDASENSSVSEGFQPLPEIVRCTQLPEIVINQATFTRTKEVRRRSKSSFSLREDKIVPEKRSREFEDSFEISAILDNNNEEFDDKKFLKGALGEEYKSLDESLPVS